MTRNTNVPSAALRTAIEHVPDAVTMALEEMEGYRTLTSPGELTDMACDMNEHACYLDVRTSDFNDLYVATWREVLFRLRLDSATSDAADVKPKHVRRALDRSPHHGLDGDGLPPEAEEDGEYGSI